MMRFFILVFFLSCFYLFQLLFQFLKDFILVKLSLIFDEELILYVYKQILLLPYLFFKNRTLGEVLERIQDVIKVKNFVLQLFASLITDFLFFCVFSILLLRIHWTFSVLFSCYFFYLFVWDCSFIKRKRKSGRKYYLKVILFSLF